MLKGFRDFVLRGNVVDLAVGVVIGAAFGTVVTAFVKDLLTRSSRRWSKSRTFPALPSNYTVQDSFTATSLTRSSHSF